MSLAVGGSRPVDLSVLNAAIKLEEQKEKLHVRCSECGKKGLRAIFLHNCGIAFCPKHRYSHDCTVDSELKRLVEDALKPCKRLRSSSEYVGPPSGNSAF